MARRSRSRRSGSAWKRRSPLGSLVGLAGALVFGWFCVRLSGVYFAMLTLAFAQIAWSIAYQWTDVTGGDNGISRRLAERLGSLASALLLADARPERGRHRGACG